MQEEPKKRRGRPPKERPEPETGREVLDQLEEAETFHPRPMTQSEYDDFMRHFRAFLVASNQRRLETMREETVELMAILDRVMRGVP